MGTEQVAHDGRPPWAGTVLALATSLVVVVLVADVPLGLFTALCGVGCLGVGLWRGSQPAVSLGVAALFGAVLQVGMGRDPLWLLLAAGAVVLVWAVAGHAVRLGRQVGRSGETLRVELVQTVTTVVVVALGGGIGYLSYQATLGRQSLPGVALLLASVVVATRALRQE